MVPIYRGRDYALFGVLAGVRDYYDNGKIDDPRGLPDDVSKKIKKEAKRWGDDGHSHSWLLASELFDWKEKHNEITYSGFVSPEDARRLDKNEGFPNEWCQWTTMEDWVKREWTQPGCVLDNLIKAVKERMADVFCIWDWLDEEEKEEKYKKYADKFRIVFWFDN